MSGKSRAIARFPIVTKPEHGTANAPVITIAPIIPSFSRWSADMQEI
jgi:hypothetical protein